MGDYQRQNLKSEKYTCGDLVFMKKGDQGGCVHVKEFAVSAVATTGTQDSGITLPDKAEFIDLALKVTTAESTGSTKKMDVGPADNPDGYADGIATSATGWVRPDATVTEGTNANYYSACTRGTALCDYVAGSDATGDTGIYKPKPDFTGGGQKIVWSLKSADCAELKGTVKITYKEFT